MTTEEMQQTIEDQARMIERLKGQITAALDEIVRIRLEIRAKDTP